MIYGEPRGDVKDVVYTIVGGEDELSCITLILVHCGGVEVIPPYRGNGTALAYHVILLSTARFLSKDVMILSSSGSPLRVGGRRRM